MCVAVRDVQLGVVNVGQSLRWYVCVWPWCPIAGVVDVNVALGFVEHTCTAGRAG